MNIKPIGNKILIKLLKEEKSDSPIILKDNNKQYSEGLVLEIGDTEEVKKISKDNKILFLKNSGLVIKDDLVLVAYESILALIK